MAVAVASSYLQRASSRARLVRAYVVRHGREPIPLPTAHRLDPFAPFLEPLAPGARRRLHGKLVVLTDIFTWRLLRRDLGFGQRQTELAMTEMVNAVLSGGK